MATILIIKGLGTAEKFQLVYRTLSKYNLLDNVRVSEYGLCVRFSDEQIIFTEHAVLADPNLCNIPDHEMGHFGQTLIICFAKSNCKNVQNTFGYSDVNVVMLGDEADCMSDPQIVPQPNNYFSFLTFDPNLVQNIVDCVSLVGGMITIVDSIIKCYRFFRKRRMDRMHESIALEDIFDED